jgi:DNA-directed RNA polymerase alpha subunit
MGGVVCVRVEVPIEWIPRVEAILAELAPLSELRLSIRATNCLETDGITMVRELCCRTADELLLIRNLNEATLKEICEKLAGRGLHLRQV